MKSIVRGWGGPRLVMSSLWLSLAVVSVHAQQPAVNPLRAAPREEKRVEAITVEKPATTVEKPARAIGTSVRTENSPAVMNRGTVATRRASAVTAANRQQGVVPAAYGQRISHPGASAHTLPQPYTGSSVLQGNVTVEKLPGDNQRGQMMEGQVVDGEYSGEYYDGFGGADGGECGGLGGCNECVIRCPCIPIDTLTFFGGVQGFTGPKNRGQTGSFGFHEGFNWGAPVPCFGDCLSMQMGARFTQSNLSGAEFTPETRDQVFLTGGLFRRVDWGLQGGIVIDYLSDDWYTQTDLTQLRAELAWVFPCGHELGFWTNQSTKQQTAVSTVFTAPAVFGNVAETWQATDIYAFFYRHHFQQWDGATARAFAGFSGEGDGLIGADLHIPFGGDFALQAGFTYLVPEESKGPAGAGNEQESWNVAMSLVWYPCSGRAMVKSYSTPLFNVADNGSFMVDRTQ